jgi:hypothetical protein
MTYEEAKERAVTIMTMVEHGIRTAALDSKPFTSCGCEWCTMVASDEGIDDDTLMVAYALLSLERTMRP